MVCPVTAIACAFARMPLLSRKQKNILKAEILRTDFLFHSMKDD